MATTTDAPHREFVAALWVLVRTAAAQDAGLRPAAEACRKVLHRVLAGGTHVVLQERDGALFANGLRVRPDVQSFAATAGITALLQEYGISELLLLPEATVDDLVVLARCLNEETNGQDLESLLRQRGCVGVHAAGTDAGAGVPVDPLVAPAVMAAPSQLGAVFTMQRFAEALGAAGPLSGLRARAALQSVLHRLLRSSSGLEPLTRFQRDPTAQAEAARACVLAVRSAEELGWEDDRCTAAGIAALLGAGAASEGDNEVAELARAAQAVAALIGPGSSPDAALDVLQMQGQMPPFVAEAMEQALIAP